MGLLRSSLNIPYSFTEFKAVDQYTHIVSTLIPRYLFRRGHVLGKLVKVQIAVSVTRRCVNVLHFLEVLLRGRKFARNAGDGCQFCAREEHVGALAQTYGFKTRTTPRV